MYLAGASFLWKLGTSPNVNTLIVTTGFVVSATVGNQVNLSVAPTVTAALRAGYYVDLFQFVCRMEL